MEIMVKECVLDHESCSNLCPYKLAILNSIRSEDDCKQKKTKFIFLVKSQEVGFTVSFAASKFIVHQCYDNFFSKYLNK